MKKKMAKRICACLQTFQANAPKSEWIIMFCLYGTLIYFGRQYNLFRRYKSLQESTFIQSY